MKKLIFVFAGLLLTITASAQDSSPNTVAPMSCKVGFLTAGGKDLVPPVTLYPKKMNTGDAVLDAEGYIIEKYVSQGYQFDAMFLDGKIASASIRHLESGFSADFEAADTPSVQILDGMLMNSKANVSAYVNCLSYQKNK